MRKRTYLKVAALVLAMSLAGWTAPANALVPLTDFDADLEEDGDIQMCNRNGLESAYYFRSIANLNADTSLLPGADPLFVDVTDSGEFCEALVQGFNNGGIRAPFAQWNYGLHPDRLQININPDKFQSLPENQQLATVTHEMEHGAGLDHPPVGLYWCQNAVISTFYGCRSNDWPRRVTPGPQDAASFEAYWDRLGNPGGDGPYPIRNKCWDDTDADGDGVCDRFGPPALANARSARTATVTPVPTPGIVEE